MKLRDYDQTTDLMVAEAVEDLDRLDGLDPSVDEYRKAAESLKLV